MTKAQEIMKKKQFIKDEMDRQLTLKRSNFLWRYFPVGSDLSNGERVYSR